MILAAATPTGSWWWNLMRDISALLAPLYEGVVRHYSDVTMGVMVSQITSLAIVYSVVYSGADQRKHQWIHQWIHRWPVNSPHKWPVTRKIFPFDDFIMTISSLSITRNLYVPAITELVVWRSRQSATSRYRGTSNAQIAQTDQWCKQIIMS